MTFIEYILLQHACEVKLLFFINMNLMFYGILGLYLFFLKENMSNQIERAKMLWRCRRGMLELDLLLERFMAEGYDSLTPEQLAIFKRLLEEPDPDLFAWLMGASEPSLPEFKSFISWFRAGFCKSIF